MLMPFQEVLHGARWLQKLPHGKRQEIFEILGGAHAKKLCVFGQIYAKNPVFCKKKILFPLISPNFEVWGRVFLRTSTSSEYLKGLLNQCMEVFLTRAANAFEDSPHEMRQLSEICTGPMVLFDNALKGNEPSIEKKFHASSQKVPVSLLAQFRRNHRRLVAT